ncbi:hypothetical protein E1265_21385 [Streptomyces sp. 8K308]|uniref:hypothetical protein n=1 Tax=Streptomyces sp. 8K308 TaxID=2530388 RepID=UPI00104E67FD|nr:hypothetical protein [Streptomyces sp. 8K308]TDC20626.1 hypothetical protein E1265_21385 [Streptomyces sp. 8K308]
MTMTCAWSGRQFEGAGYVLQTTGGQVIVSAEAIEAAAAVGHLSDVMSRQADRLGALTARVEELESAVASLVKSQASTGSSASKSTARSKGAAGE